MDFLTTLWIPILASAVIVWFASFLTHMVFPHHKSEWKKLPNEDKVLEALSGAEPELYMFPYCTMEEMKEPAFQEKQKNGPNGILVIWKGPVNMGKNLIMTFMFYVLVGVFVAYIGSHSLDASATYLQKFQICGAVAFAAHGLGWMSFFIWFGCGRFWPNFVDAVLYALLTAGTFGWLWR